jgi:hypothetical protein
VGVDLDHPRRLRHLVGHGVDRSGPGMTDRLRAVPAP